MSDERISQLRRLPKEAASATDVLPIVDISASQTKKIRLDDLVAAGVDLIPSGEIDLSKLNQNSLTKIDAAAIASGAITATKLANDSSIAVQTTTPSGDNFEGRGFFNSSTGNLQIFNGSGYQQVVMPSGGIGDSQITTNKLANGAVTTQKVSPLGSAAYASGSVVTAALADQSVTAAKIALNSITAAQIAPNAIEASELADNSVDTNAIQNLAVTEAKIASGVVTTAKLGDAAVTNDKIANATIAYAKLNLADGSVPGLKIAADSITNTQIGAAAVGNSELADSGVTTSKIADGAVTAAKIALNSITAAQIAPNAIEASELADNAVDTNAIQNLAVTEAKIASGVVTTAKLGNAAVTNDKIANSTISYAKLNLADGSVPGAKIATDSITNAQIGAAAVGTSELIDSGVATSKIADGAVTAAKIALNSITAAQIAPNAIEASELADNAVDTNAIQNLAVTEAKIASGVVTTTKLGNAAVTNDKIANATIAYAKLNLADGSVPGAKIATDSITNAQIGAAAVDNSELADSGVTTSKVANGAITAAKIASGTITANQLSAGAVNSASLANNAVTYAKLQNASQGNVLLGRISGSGTFEEIPLTAAGRELLADASAAEQRASLGLGSLALANGTWTNGSSFAGTSTGTNTGDQTITLTGDVTGAGTSTFAATIADDAITESKILDGAVSENKIENKAISASKLDDNSGVIVSTSVPIGNGAFIGQQWVNTSTGWEYTWTGAEWQRLQGISTINFVDSSPLAFSSTLTDPFTVEITVGLDTQVASTVFAGPVTGADAAPAFRALQPTDLPVATSGTTGISRPGTGLSIDTGVLNHSNAIASGLVNGISFDAQGHITGAVALTASDIPVLDTSKITTGEFSTARYADNSVTGAKLADYSTAKIGETLSVADYTGQIFYNPLDKSFFLWDGNVWQPIGVSFGAIVFAGTYNASSNVISSITSEGSAIGLVAGSGLPAASPANNLYYLVVSSGGTGVAPAPTTTLQPPDLILSNGSLWMEIDVSSTYASQTAANIGFTPAGDIGSTNVQSAIEEVSTECRNANNITSGTLAVARGGTNISSYAKGDLIIGSGSTVLGKLSLGTNGHGLVADSTTSLGVKWAAIPSGTVTSVTSTTPALVVASGTSTSNPSLSIASASTSASGIVMLTNSTTTTSSVMAATATAVKTVADVANGALQASGSTVTGQLRIGTTGSFVFEGSVDDANKTTLAVANPTAARTITIPDQTGTLITSAGSGVVTSTMILDGTITNADINNSAAIALSKLATGALPSGITIASSNIVDGTIVNADINASAAIAGTKVSPNFGSQNIISSGTASAAALIPTGSGIPVNGTYLPEANTVAIATNSAERLRISAAGRVSIGAPALSSFLAGNNPFLQQHGTTGQNASALLGNWQTTATGPTYYFFKSQSGTVDTFGAIASGTPMGVLTFVGDNGTQPVMAGSIRCDADGTPGAEPSMPGRFVFLTTSVGGATPQERMRITSDGTVRITSVLSAGSVATENTAPANSNVTATATASSLLGGIRTGTPTANIDLQLPTGTNMDAAFGDLQNNQAFQWSVINLAAATHVITVTANTDHTVVGNMAVAATTSGRFLTRKTAANTFVTYRIS